MGDERGAMEHEERARMLRPHLFAINHDPELLDLLRILFQREDLNVTTTNFVPATFDQIAALAPDVRLVDLAYGGRGGSCWNACAPGRARIASRLWCSPPRPGTSSGCGPSPTASAATRW